MTDSQNQREGRYQRQEQFSAFGAAGQQRLAAARVLIVGMGGLGSWLSEMLVRSGVGQLRLVDNDTVDWSNLARQSLYEELDAQAGHFKAEAAAAVLARINRDTNIETVLARATAENLPDLAEGVDLILDGTDDWTTRFLLNDFAVRSGQPWVFAGAVRMEGQVMAIRPGVTACLRCVMETPPPAEIEAAAKATQQGVLVPAVAAIAAVEAGEAIKILIGHPPAEAGRLIRIDLWDGRRQQLQPNRRNDCPCCGKRIFDFLEPGRLQ